MNLIGNGAQYRAYDMLDGRVLKQPMTHSETIEVLTEWYAPDSIPDRYASDDYTVNAVNSYQFFKNLTVKYPKIADSLGNPIFLDDLSYSQDKVQPLGDALRTLYTKRGKLFIDAYADLIITHWGYGFCDKVFNFTINNGINNLGRVILLDFGEVSFSKADIAKRIHSKRWLDAWSYTIDCPINLKEYYEDKMNDSINLKKLNDTWKKAL